MYDDLERKGGYCAVSRCGAARGFEAACVDTTFPDPDRLDPAVNGTAKSGESSHKRQLMFSLNSDSDILFDFLH